MSSFMVRVTGTGAAITGGARLFGLHYATTAATGRITLADSSATGTPLVDLDAAPAAGSEHVELGQGVVFAGGVTVTALTNVTAVSLVYDDLS